VKKKNSDNGRFGVRERKKKTAGVDQCVGLRVRAQRLARGISQYDLAARLGITFQQVQKYERGSNRIAASRLFEMAQILDVPVAYFYEDLIGGPRRYAENSMRNSEASRVIEFATTSEGFALIRAYSSVTDTGARRHLLQLIRATAAMNR